MLGVAIGAPRKVAFSGSALLCHDIMAAARSSVLVLVNTMGFHKSREGIE